MSHTCSCAAHPEPSPPMTRPSAEQTVAEMSTCRGAREVFQRLGVNYCCGAHLSLCEAAAAAGISLDELVRALERPAAVTR
jgi:iron-sulfur cluster repair protein YtfE (RIC family)